MNWKLIREFLCVAVVISGGAMVALLFVGSQTPVAIGPRSTLLLGMFGAPMLALGVLLLTAERARAPRPGRRLGDGAETRDGSSRGVIR